MSDRELRLAVVSDHTLVAEAVRAALAGRGFHAEVIPWASSQAAVSPDVGLIVCDLQPLRHLEEAQALVEQVRAPWLLLTSEPRGPLWGAMLESGVEVALSSTSTLDQAVTALRRLADGAVLMTEQSRRELKDEWASAIADRELLIQQVQSLTPRERTVLKLLFAGDAVRTIAEVLGVSEATVRSHVRAVLRKMEVNSQLAAVSVLGGLRDGGPGDWSRVSTVRGATA